MDKKELKFYDAPACEVVEFNVKGQLLAGSTPEGTTITTDDDDWAEE